MRQYLQVVLKICVLLWVMGCLLVILVTQQCVEWGVNSTVKSTQYGCLQISIFGHGTPLFGQDAPWVMTILKAYVFCVVYKDSDEWSELAKPCHKRSAEKVLHGCLKNGGLYIKLGQGLVSMNHILPKEYIDTLEVLQDKALARGHDEVC